MDPAIERILDYCTHNDNGCLIHKNGDYSKTNFNGRTQTCHRIMYIIVNNGGEQIPEFNEDGDPMCIRHMCNVPSCVNPEHLLLGTFSENNYEDKKKNGTLLVGEKNPRCTISKELATNIKHSKYPRGHKKYMTIKKRANFFNVEMGLVSSIDSNASWSDIPDRFGRINLKNMDKKRNRTRCIRRKSKLEEWSEIDFACLGKKIKSNIMESDDNKRGYMPHGKCWEWIKSKNKYGYGQITFKNVNTNSHIMSCVVKHRRKMEKGEIVRHLCDNKICCNPDHLKIGTRGENGRDAFCSEYITEHSHRIKLTPSDVTDIYQSHKKVTDLMIEYKVGMTCIYNIRRGKSWKDITNKI